LKKTNYLNLLHHVSCSKQSGNFSFPFDQTFFASSNFSEIISLLCKNEVDALQDLFPRKLITCTASTKSLFTLLPGFPSPTFRSFASPYQRISLVGNDVFHKQQL